MIRLDREPTHAGEILKEEFLTPLGITQSKIAQDLHVSFRAINELINQKRGMTTEMALKLSKYFGTSPELWLNIQNQYDMNRVIKNNKVNLDEIKHYSDIVA